jgi:hypothetical protein
MPRPKIVSKGEENRSDDGRNAAETPPAQCTDKRCENKGEKNRDSEWDEDWAPEIEDRNNTNEDN